MSILLIYYAGKALMTAGEVFISLHSIDAVRDGVPLRKVMACLDPCMKDGMRATFPPESMAVALQQLVTRLDMLTVTALAALVQ